MAALETLPAEVLDVILPLLTADDLLRLTTTSKRLCAAAQTFLYRDIVFRWEDGASTAPVHRLLRTFLGRPELCEYVEELTLDGWLPLESFNITKWYNYDVKPIPAPAVDQREFSSLEVQLAKNLVQSLDLPPEENDLWCQALDKGEQDVFVALLISQCTHLKSIYLNAPYQKDSKFTGRVIGRASRRPIRERFPLLEHVEYTGSSV